MRICVELQLHCRPPSSATYSPNEEQRRRKVFWECYSLDRFASSTLGRPFAINDSMISVELPEATDGDNGRTIDSRNADADHALFQDAMDLRVSNHLLRLARITSEIHYLFPPRSATPSGTDTHASARISSWASKPGEVYPILLTCHKKLKSWLASSPHYPNPECVPQSEEYFELAYQKERLNLFRTAIDRFSDSMPSPPEVLLNSCVHAACRTINIFNSLRRRNLLTCTRPHTHHVFTTGLVLVFSVFVQLQARGRRSASGSEVDLGVWWTELDDGAEVPSMVGCLEALDTAGRVLSWFAEQMPDMDAHARFFWVLKRELGEIAGNCLGQESGTSSSLSGGPRIQQECGDQRALDDMSVPAAHHGSPCARQQPEAHGSQTTATRPAELGLTDPRGAGTSLLTGPSSPSSLLAGIMQNNAGAGAGHTDMPPASWPFSNMAWMEGVESLLSGYEWEMIDSGLSPPENLADLDMLG